MSLSKERHVLVIARKAAGLNQTELAQLAGCSPATIQSIELLRLKLSKGLAARIAQGIGCDLDWLLENDLSKEMPPVRGPEFHPVNQVEGATIAALDYLFGRLLAVAVRQPKTLGRAALEFYLVQMVEDLRKRGQELDAESRLLTNAWEFFQRNPKLLDVDLRKILNLEELVRLNQEEARRKYGRTAKIWVESLGGITRKPSRPPSKGRPPASARGTVSHLRQSRNSE
jgi:transcriptional regulator with XRE-family HTH domain